MSDDFFSQSLEQSRVKTKIVLDYFKTWSGIISSVVKKTGARKIGYIDLFSGPGIYEDETKSTPILILEYATENPDIAQILETHFNDVNPDFVLSLKDAVNAIPNINKLKYQPQITNFEVDDDVAQEFRRKKLPPTLSFIDPWGYKGLSLNLVKALLKDWGCDCIFFFNYNRIRAAIENSKVENIINSLFGAERANKLRMKLKDLDPNESELEVINELVEALEGLTGIGEVFVLPFRFRDENGNRTSHHLILVSKHFLAYERMREVMANVSSSKEQGVASLEFNQASERQPMLYGFSRPLEDLKGLLLEHFAGQTLSMEKIYKAHTIGTRYIRKNYKVALDQLANAGIIGVSDPEGKKRKSPNFPERLIVTFPPKE